MVGVKCAGLSAGLDYLGVPGCENSVTGNAAEPDAQIYKEHILVPNTRSDLVVQLSDGKALILEDVNTHVPKIRHERSTEKPDTQSSSKKCTGTHWVSFTQG